MPRERVLENPASRRMNTAGKVEVGGGRTTDALQWARSCNTQHVDCPAAFADEGLGEGIVEGCVRACGVQALLKDSGPHRRDQKRGSVALERGRARLARPQRGASHSAGVQGRGRRDRVNPAGIVVKFCNGKRAVLAAGGEAREEREPKLKA